MHTYSKNGMRISKVQNNKNVKNGIKGFYTRLAQIEEICKYLRTLEQPVTEENIDSIVPELIGRELDSMERFLILGKLDRSDEEDNIK